MSQRGFVSSKYSGMPVDELASNISREYHRISYKCFYFCEDDDLLVDVLARGCRTGSLDMYFHFFPDKHGVLRVGGRTAKTAKQTLGHADTTTARKPGKSICRPCYPTSALFNACILSHMLCRATEMAMSTLVTSPVLRSKTFKGGCTFVVVDSAKCSLCVCLFLRLPHRCKLSFLCSRPISCLRCSACSFYSIPASPISAAPMNSSAWSIRRW